MYEDTIKVVIIKYNPADTRAEDLRSNQKNYIYLSNMNLLIMI